MLIAIGGAMLCVTGIAAALIIGGLNEKSTPILATVLSSLGIIVSVLVSAFSAQNAQHSAQQNSKEISTASAQLANTTRTVEYTASQLGTIKQAVIAAHMDCPRKDCPLGLNMDEKPT